MGTPGFDYIGIGVGAVIFDRQRRVFLAQRGPLARNEQGTWEFPGGMVNLGEALDDAIRREILEEYGMKIEPTGILGVFDHFLPRGEHWVSVTYRGRHLHGDPEIREPEKCMAIGWFHLNEIPHHLSLITQKNLAELRREGAF